MKKLWASFAFAGILAACGAEPSTDSVEPKPSANPDATLSGERADALSDRWTTRMGELAIDGKVEATIGYPDWFHGYTLDLQEGQEITVSIAASELGYVRFYGPSHRTNASGEPQFRNTMGGADTTFGGNFGFTVPQTGTYLVLYGPEFVWTADYSIEVACENCGPVRCDDSADCGAGEFCGDNGVRCITAPCDVNFDVCQPLRGDGESCNLDEMCADGLACVDGKCGAVAADECQTADDCGADEFCGYATDRTRVCKPHAAEGEYCGGFVRPEDYVTCPEDLACVAPDFIADIRGNCGVAVTVDELLADPAAYEGRFVGVKGALDVGPMICTQIACDVANPCCNACGADQLLFADRGDAGSDAGIALRDDNGDGYSCGGNECTTADNCTRPRGIYWLGGTFSVDPVTGRATLDVARAYQGF